jgi:hypothetical protein
MSVQMLVFAMLTPKAGSAALLWPALERHSVSRHSVQGRVALASWKSVIVRTSPAPLGTVRSTRPVRSEPPSAATASGSAVPPSVAVAFGTGAATSWSSRRVVGTDGVPVCENRWVRFVALSHTQVAAPHGPDLLSGPRTLSTTVRVRQAGR